MNINVLLGTIAFCIWSVVSIWFYSNFIKDVEPIEDEVVAVVAEPEEKIEMVTEAKTDVAKEAEVVNLNKNFTFDLNSDIVIDQQGLENFIQEVKTAIDGRDISIKITGHTCSRGSEKYNEVLGLKRAQSVKNILAAAGFDNMKIQSDGETNPLVSNDTEENRSKNRRVSISITTKS
ncbi:MAG: OmpA family protein [Reichenbachiella sp.]